MCVRGSTWTGLDLSFANRSQNRYICNVKESLIRNTLIQEMKKKLPPPPGDLTYEDMVDEAIYKKGV